MNESLEQKPGKSLDEPFIEAVLVLPWVGTQATLGGPIASSTRVLKHLVPGLDKCPPQPYSKQAPLYLSQATEAPVPM